MTTINATYIGTPAMSSEGPRRFGDTFDVPVEMVTSRRWHATGDELKKATGDELAAVAAALGLDLDDKATKTQTVSAITKTLDERRRAQTPPTPKTDEPEDVTDAQ